MAPSPNLSQSLLVYIPILLSIIISSSYPAASSSSLPTIAISHVKNKTLVCALLPPSSPDDSSGYALNCTGFPGGIQRAYPSGAVPYSGIAAGDGFLCALSSQISSNTSAMRWWEFSHSANTSSGGPEVKRVYHGPAIGTLASGEYHVCALRRDTGGLLCWRWRHLPTPKGARFAEITVGNGFLCGLMESGAVRCFGDCGDCGVVGREPSGNFTTVAAGSSHACAVSIHGGELQCWGSGAPERWKTRRPPSEIKSLALGDNRTCALRFDGTVLCSGNKDGGFELAGDLSGEQFMTVHAKGEAFCGVLLTNYSVICWGSKAFNRSHVMVYSRALPGSCTSISTCSCGVLPGSGNICVGGAGICMPCNRKSIPISPPPTPPNEPKSGGGRIGRRTLAFIIAGAAGLGIVVAIVASSLVYSAAKKRSGGRVHDDDTAAAPEPPRLSTQPLIMPVDGGSPFSMGHSTTIEEFPMQLLQSITDGFSEDHRIGSGSFGTVYRATLDDGREVAIKRAATSIVGAAGGQKQKDKEFAFMSELNLLSRVNHKNLVRLMGFCREGRERVLVFEFMTNATLHDHLHKLQTSPLSSSWPARLRVALDAARGIEYLHTYAVPPIIHRDIKSSNILLDESWTAKVADFGVSLLDDGGGGGEADGDDEARTAGTVGYMDPEYYRLQNLTAKSDVYSFGVVLLELLSGCRVIQRYEESNTPRNIVEFAVPHIAADEIHRLLDPKLPPPAPAEVESVAYVGYLAADCVGPEGRSRPTMTEVVGALERAVAAISAAAVGVGAASNVSAAGSSSSRSSTAWSN